MIYDRFVGYIEISGGDRKRNHTANTRKGVAVQYLNTTNYRKTKRNRLNKDIKLVITESSVLEWLDEQTRYNRI